MCWFLMVHVSPVRFVTGLFAMQLATTRYIPDYLIIVISPAIYLLYFHCNLVFLLC